MEYLEGFEDNGTICAPHLVQIQVVWLSLSRAQHSRCECSIILLSVYKYPMRIMRLVAFFGFAHYISLFIFKLLSDIQLKKKKDKHGAEYLPLDGFFSHLFLKPQFHLLWALPKKYKLLFMHCWGAQTTIGEDWKEQKNRIQILIELFFRNSFVLIIYLTVSRD